MIHPNVIKIKKLSSAAFSTAYFPIHNRKDPYFLEPLGNSETDNASLPN